ncbi:MAG: phosphopantetheine-binding protein, partial [Bacteroidota bacterium]
ADVPSSHICLTTNIYEDLEMDTIDYLTLILRLERLFKIELRKEEVEGLETVKEILDCFQLHMHSKAEAC